MNFQFSLLKKRIYHSNPCNEGVIELLSHRDDLASRIVSAFVVVGCDNEAKAPSSVIPTGPTIRMGLRVVTAMTLSAKFLLEVS